MRPLGSAEQLQERISAFRQQIESFCLKVEVQGTEAPNYQQNTCGSFRKLGVPNFWGPYNKDPTI